MSKGGVDAVRLEFRGPDRPSCVEVAYVQTAIEAAFAIHPDLDRFLDSITFRRPMKEPRNFRHLNDDERFVLRFLAVNGHYTFKYGPITPGQIAIDYIPHVDFLTAATLHELSHVLVRADDPDAPNRNRLLRKRQQIHGYEWSAYACSLYQQFGCEKAALFSDGCNYKSTRARHRVLLPHEAQWAGRVWSLIDQGRCGELRREFAELFIP